MSRTAFPYSSIVTTALLGLLSACAEQPAGDSAPDTDAGTQADTADVDAVDGHFLDGDPLDGDLRDDDSPDGEAALDTTDDGDSPAPPDASGADVDPEADSAPLPHDCPGGVWQCAEGEGCHAGSCGLCQSNADCPAGDTCAADGSCGPCSVTDECSDGQVCRHGFCLDQVTPGLSLRVAPADWDRLEADVWEKVWVPCTVSLAGEAAGQACEVRFHGGSSRAFPKHSLRIRLVEGSAPPGFAPYLILRAEYNDRSFLRNALSHETFRRLAGVPTPRTRFVTLDLNDVRYGLFLEVERVQADFLARNALDPAGPTFEADPPLDLFLAGVGSLVPLPSDLDYRLAFDQATGSVLDYAELQTFIEDVLWLDYQDARAGGSGVARLGEAADLEAMIGYLAAMGLVQNHDHVRKNYYLGYQADPVGRRRWTLYPWDLDLTFGCLYDDAAETTLCNTLVTDASYQRGVLPEGIEAGYPVAYFFNLLIHHLWTDPETEPRLRGRLCAMLASDWWQDRLPAYVEALAETIAPAVEADPSDRNTAAGEFRGAVDGLHAFISARGVYLEEQLGCEP